MPQVWSRVVKTSETTNGEAIRKILAVTLMEKVNVPLVARRVAVDMGVVEMVNVEVILAWPRILPNCSLSCLLTQGVWSLSVWDLKL